MADQERTKFITVPPKGGDLYPTITKEESNRFSEQVKKVISVIGSKGLAESCGATTANDINTAIDNFTKIAILAYEGYCKIDFDYFISKYEKNQEVKFAEIANIVNNSFNKVKSFEKDYKDRSLNQ